jgi:hypothetical protein
MGTRRAQINWVLPWLVCWACRAGTRDFCSALVALVSPVQNIFFLAVHYFNSLVPITQQARQAAVLGRLSLSMYLWVQLLDKKTPEYAGTVQRLDKNTREYTGKKVKFKKKHKYTGTNVGFKKTHMSIQVQLWCRGSGTDGSHLFSDPDLSYVLCNRNGKISYFCG